MKQFVSYLLVFFLLFLRNRSNRDKKKKPKIVTKKASKEKKTHTKKKECKIFSVCFIGCKRLKTHSCSIQYEAAKVCADTTQLFRVFAFNERSRHLVSRLFCIDCFIIWVCSLRTNTNKPLTHSQKYLSIYLFDAWPYLVSIYPKRNMCDIRWAKTFTTDFFGLSFILSGVLQPIHIYRLRYAMTTQIQTYENIFTTCNEMFIGNWNFTLSHWNAVLPFSQVHLLECCMLSSMLIESKDTI